MQLPPCCTALSKVPLLTFVCIHTCGSNMQHKTPITGTAGYGKACWVNADNLSQRRVQVWLQVWAVAHSC
jgi:hypothetical protein